jgi:hypothetical protein
MSTPPTLPAYSDGVHLLVWCAFCRRYHVHGGGLDGPEGGGHRVADCCTPGSPYERTGYVLEYAGPAPTQMIEDRHRQKPKGPPCLN